MNQFITSDSNVVILNQIGTQAEDSNDDDFRFRVWFSLYSPTLDFEGISTSSKIVRFSARLVAMEAKQNVLVFIDFSDRPLVLMLLFLLNV